MLLNQGTSLMCQNHFLCIVHTEALYFICIWFAETCEVEKESFMGACVLIVCMNSSVSVVENNTEVGMD